MRIFFVTVFFVGVIATGLMAVTTHVVKKNETLGGIAQRYGVSVSALQAYNGIANPNLLYVGKKLKIPSGNVREVSYTVKKGDSLGLIAKRFGVTASDLALINKISRPDLIRVGQKLTIPISGSRRPPTPKLLDSTTLSRLNSIRPKAGKWQRIIIHHSATPIDDALNMHKVHLARGMKNGLAYHFVISNGSRKARDGEIYLSNRWKGQLDGGHVKKHSANQTSIGICLIGNFEVRPPTSKQISALEGLCEYLMKRCNLRANDVTTHTIFHPKHTVCPGKHFSLSGLRRRLID
ncbi:MAG: peptidoglycan-binding protein [Opitutae bacterium]|nr:peptidoglycan-binding protein [Opitutae bacterium]